MARTLVTALLTLLWVCSPAFALDDDGGRVRGVVADGSGGVLPGVTVMAIAADGRVLATAVSDAVGRYAFGALPPARVTLSFELDGFSTATADVEVRAGAESLVPIEQLTLAPRAETVEVVARVPVYVPAPPREPPPPPPPPPVVLPVPEHDRDSICGPAKPAARAESLGTIRGLRYGAGNGLYASGDELAIDGGLIDGLEVARNLVVRRSYRVSGGGETGEHTAGLIQIVDAAEHTSVGVVIYACDELMRGDRLASFEPEPVRVPEPPGIPVFDGAARILFADAGQLLGVPRRLMVIDHGRDHDIRVGQRLTLFRRQRSAAGPSVVGDAVVVAVRGDSATIRVEQASDVIAFGDWAAPQRPAS